MDDILNCELMHPSDQITLIISRIYQRGMTTTSGGNISIIDEYGDIWITPSAIDKGTLTAADIICVKSDGSIIGKHKPSSEFPFHKAIYENRPDLKAIIHAHPPALVSFSIVRQIPNTNVITQAKNVCGSIGYADYELPGSKALGEKIAEEFKKGYKAIIMENHGTVLGGSDLNDAYDRFETFEFCARAILFSKALGNTNYLTDQQIEAYDSQVPALIPEQETVTYPPDEKEKRTEICNIVRRACRQGLMISSYGTVSVRWKKNDFLITPTHLSRWNILLEDVVQIKDGQREPGKIPSRSVMLHQKIYEQNPHINSIIITQPPYLMAFGIGKTKFDVRTIPESWIFLQDVPILSYGSQFEKETIIPNILSKTPAIIIQNDSIMVTGDKLLQTFDKLEVAEFSAKSLVLAVPLGVLVPINDSQIEELRKAFLG